jgi:uncharacterized protein YijF (DUF1287 family)
MPVPLPMRAALHLLVLLIFAFPVNADETSATKLIDSARKQIGVTTHYDPAYVSLDYPNGDIPKERGVCTDVVIRAFRDALKWDLQKLVHEDMKANFAKYPKIWGLKKPDKNIDHRRVPNLQVYFSRHAQKLKPTTDPANYRPGDLVTCIVGGNLPHIMIVSDKKNAADVPHIIHNIGHGTQEEDCLFQFPLTGHYRLR